MKKSLKKTSLAERVIMLVECARQKVAAAANLAQVYMNYEIGRQIVEEEQKGRSRAGYGEKIIEELSAKLTARFGRGWSMRNLETIRKFFLTYVQEIPQTASAEFRMADSANTVCGIWKSEVESRHSANMVGMVPRFTLGWSHYLLLMRIKDPVERAFYEREATDGAGCRMEARR